MEQWAVDYLDDAFERFVRGLPAYEQAVLFAAVENVLAVMGIDICSGEWGKPLGGGLYEFRVAKSLAALSTTAPSVSTVGDRQVLLRVFCTFHGSRIVLLMHGYNKRTDPSKNRQQREIAKARKLLAAWRRGA